MGFIHDVSNVILLGLPESARRTWRPLAESAIRARRPAYFMTTYDLADDLHRAYRQGHLDRRMKVYRHRRC